MPLGFVEVKGLESLFGFKIPEFLYQEIFHKSYLALMWDVAETVLRQGFQVERVQDLEPIGREDGADTEWAVMEAGRYELQDLQAGGNVILPSDVSLDAGYTAARPAEVRKKHD